MKSALVASPLRRSSRIEALKPMTSMASLPDGTLDGLVANASALSPAAVLAMMAE